MHYDFWMIDGATKTEKIIVLITGNLTTPSDTARGILLWPSFGLTEAGF
jgi:hypothetical protein